MQSMPLSSPVFLSCGSAFSLQTISFSLSILLLSIVFSWVEGLNQQHQYFIYPQAPQRLVVPARRLGKLEHLNYIRSVSNIRDDEEKLNLYTQHFSQCASIGDEASESSLQPTTTIASLLKEGASIFSSLGTSVQQLVDALGFDPIASKFFNLPANELQQTIQSACLKNELQFQCAYGFLNDLDKIEEHIQLMKENDGTFKVMSEKECGLANQAQPSRDSSVFPCINSCAPALLNQCQQSIQVYNSTRLEVNSKMQTNFMATVSTIEENAEIALSNGKSETLESVLWKGESLIKSTLNEMLHIEAFKCRHYTQMERCLLGVVGDVCAPSAVESLATILRVGYLQRERGDTLHQQFLEAGIAPHRACQVFV